MSDNSTKRMLRRLQVAAAAPLFLASSFQTPPENIHDSEHVEVDVERDEEDVAVVVHSISANGNENEQSLFVNKQWTPPVYKERTTLNVFDAIKRQAGQLPTDTIDYRANVVLVVNKAIGSLVRKLRRGIELQASQVKQTGKLTLDDKDGNVRFTLDYKPKSSHFPTAANNWGGGSETPLADLSALARTIRSDGKKRPDKLTFGRTAWLDFMADAEVQAQFDNRRIDVGRIEPTGNEDATKMGTIRIDNYPFDLWVYDAEYKDPSTSILTPYVTDDLVIMEASGARKDLTFGNIPRFPEANRNTASYLPRRVTFSDSGIDFMIDAWFSEDGTTLTVQVSTRALCIPTEIDSFGALDTRA